MSNERTLQEQIKILAGMVKDSNATIASLRRAIAKIANIPAVHTSSPVEMAMRAACHDALYSVPDADCIALPECDS